MFITHYVIASTVILIVARDANCYSIQQSTLSDVFNLKSLEKFTAKLLDNVKKSRVLQLNDFISIETITNTTDGIQEHARLLDKLEDISNTKSLNLNLGLVDLRLFRDAGELNIDLKLDSRKSKDEKEGGQMLLPLFIGLKATTLVIGVVSLIGLLTLKAFIASKTAILIAVVLGLKKLFGGHQKTTYEAVHDRYSSGPEYHQISDHRNELEIFNGHPEIPEQKFLNDQKDVFQDNNDTPKYEFQEQEASPELPNGNDFHGLFRDDLQEFKISESHQKRRNWKSNGKRNPLSLVIGSPHHEPPVLTYRKVVTGRNS